MKYKYIKYVTALSVLLIVWFNVDIVKVRSNSMYPNYKEGDNLLMVRFYLEPKDGDVIVFKSKEDLFIKRVASLNNQTMYFNQESENYCNSNKTNFAKIKVPNKGKKIISNDSLIYHKKFIEWETRKNVNIRKDGFYLGINKIKSYVFNKNFFFVLGDNINESIDSRTFGLITESEIVGKIAFKLW